MWLRRSDEMNGGGGGDRYDYVHEGQNFLSASSLREQRDVHKHPPTQIFEHYSGMHQIKATVITAIL